MTPPGEVMALPVLDCVPAVVCAPSRAELVRPMFEEPFGFLGIGVDTAGDEGRALFVGIRDRDGVTYAAALPLAQALAFHRKLSARIAELAVE